jgi:hypothetical protein
MVLVPPLKMTFLHKFLNQKVDLKGDFLMMNAAAKM